MTLVYKLSLSVATSVINHKLNDDAKSHLNIFEIVEHDVLNFDMEHRIPIRELNHNTSTVLNKVINGSAITITRYGKAIVRILPVTNGDSALDELVANGQAIAPSVTGPIAMLLDYGDQSIEIATYISQDRENEKY